MAYGFINFLFLLLSHISLIFSFNYSVFTTSISTLPYSFFFPLPFCSILFPFMNMSHHRFPLYHHWSIKSPSPVFFPLLFALSSLFYLRVTYQHGFGCGFVIFDCDRHESLGCGSLLPVLSWIADSLFVMGLGCGGFVCVCVLLTGVIGLPLCLSFFFSSIWVFWLFSFFSLIWVLWLWLWWWLFCDVCVFCSLVWRVCLSDFLFFSYRSGFCDYLLSSSRFGFCDYDGGCFVIWKRKVVAGPFFFFLRGGFWLPKWRLVLVVLWRRWRWLLRLDFVEVVFILF